MKPRILICLSYFLPGFKSGGPIQSIANLVERLGDEISFHILTRDRDKDDTVAYPGVPNGKWITAGNHSLYYAPPERLSISNMARVIASTPHDAVYVNSFFNPRFAVQPLLLRHSGIIPRKPIILAPRGEFSKGALSLKAFKKKSYLAAGKMIGLFDDVLWQASSEHEADDIRRELGSSGNGIIISPDLPRRFPVSPSHNRARAPGQPLRIIFLSRISRMKNLDFALRVLNAVRHSVAFTIYGPIEDESYWAQCSKIIADLPPHIIVEYRGSVAPDRVPDALSGHDLFFLPTLGENYGHVIIEALQAGLPTLISDRTPWRNLQTAGVGADFSLSDPLKFQQFIESLSETSPIAFEELRSRTSEYGRSILDNDQIVAAARSLFSRALHTQLPNA